MGIALVPGDRKRTQFEAWVKEYSTLVLRTCFVYLGNLTLAEDALQDTFMKVWRNMDAFESRNGSTAKTWIVKIAINTCRDYRASAWRRHVDLTNALETLPPSVLEVTDESRDMFLSVMKLPEKLKQVVIMYHYHDMNMTEIAESLAISRPAVHKRLKKAYAIMKTQLEGGDPNET